MGSGSLAGGEVGTDTARLRPGWPGSGEGSEAGAQPGGSGPSEGAAVPQGGQRSLRGGTGPARRGRSGVGRDGGEEGAGTVALAVRNSASWLMLETSGELFMITRIRDRGSDTSRFSPPLNLAAIFSPSTGSSPSPPTRSEMGGRGAARRAGSCSPRPPAGEPGAVPAGLQLP